MVSEVTIYFEPHMIGKCQFLINHEIIASRKYFFSNTNIFFCSKIALFSHLIFICLEQKNQQNLFKKTVN